MSEWLECVPNFSEGRDPAVLDRLAAVVGRVPGVRLLGREMDADHHRAVVTIAGEATAVERAAFELARVAVECIDLACHTGVHKRTGALDVCPFVPLHDTPMERAVAAAERVGGRIARELSVPVFLYAAAARRPERRVLGHVRNRGFEALREHMPADPDLTPDHGPERGAPDGRCVLGGRAAVLDRLQRRPGQPRSRTGPSHRATGPREQWWAPCGAGDGFSSSVRWGGSK